MIYINRIFAAAQGSSIKSITPEKLAPILAYIDENLENDLSLEAIGNRFFLNRFYLSKLFRKSTGSNLHEYIIYKRVSKARRLLSEGHSVTDTAALCGFNDYSNFLRMFKKSVGITPGQYRKNSRGLDEA